MNVLLGINNKVTIILIEVIKIIKIKNASPCCLWQFQGIDFLILSTIPTTLRER
jgi:hypothetical protein